MTAPSYQGDEMENGMELDRDLMIEVLQSKLAAMAVREGQLEAGIQQVILERNKLAEELARYQEPSKAGVPDPTSLSGIPDVLAPAPHTHQEE
jgi:hypothetical protein